MGTTRITQLGLPLWTNDRSRNLNTPSMRFRLALLNGLREFVNSDQLEISETLSALLSLTGFNLVPAHEKESADFIYRGVADLTKYGGIFCDHKLQQQFIEIEQHD